MESKCDQISARNHQKRDWELDVTFSMYMGLAGRTQDHRATGWGPTATRPETETKGKIYDYKRNQLEFVLSQLAAFMIVVNDLMRIQ